MVKRYVPDSGDVVKVNFNPTKGSEQANYRPAVVVSLKKYNQASGLAIVCPITSKSKGYPFEVELQKQNISGVVLSDQIRSIDWQARKVRFVETMNQACFRQVKKKISLLIS